MPLKNRLSQPQGHLPTIVSEPMSQDEASHDGPIGARVSSALTAAASIGAIGRGVMGSMKGLTPKFRGARLAWPKRIVVEASPATPS